VVNAIHSACVLTLDVLKLIGKALRFSLPSGLAITLIDENGEVPDFTWEDKLFWAVRVKLWGFGVAIIPLPKTPVDKVWEFIVRPINPPLSGSENWLYWDESTSTYKYGTEFTPNKFYHVLTDGVHDISLFALVSLVVYVLIKFKLIKTAFEFVKKVYGWAWERWMYNTVWDMDENIERMMDEIDNVTNTSEDIDNTLDLTEMKELLNEIRNRIGLKLALR
jgi:hypothetical protein